jgi:hypothetical protein
MVAHLMALPSEVETGAAMIADINLKTVAIHFTNPSIETQCSLPSQMNPLTSRLITDSSMTVSVPGC